MSLAEETAPIEQDNAQEPSPVCVDRDAMRAFLEEHTRDWGPDEAVEIRAFRDGKGRTSGGRGARCLITQSRTAAVQFAGDWADRGYGVHYGIQPRKPETKSFGKNTDVARVRYLWADLDAKDYRGGKEEAYSRLSDCLFKPALITEGGGGYHALWRIKDVPNVEAARAIEDRLVHALGADRDARGLARVFRLPGSYNHNYDPPALVELIGRAQPMVTYPFKEFDFVLPHLPDPLPIVRPLASASPVYGERPDLAEVREALRYVSPTESYDEWVKTLMAIHSAFPGEDGLAVAEAWCADARRANDQQHDVAGKWRGFNGHGIGLGTLFAKAKAGGWERPGATFVFDGPAPEGRAGVTLSSAGRLAAGTVYPCTPLHELLAEPDRPDEWLVDNLLIRGGMSMLVAAPKVGKTTLAQNIALAVAAGDRVLGRATIQCPVLYVALEGRRQDLKHQFDRLAGGESAPLHVYTGDAGPTPAASLAGTINEVGAGLVVIDTIGLFLGASDLNDYATVLNHLKPLIEIVRTTDAHIMFTHHARKGAQSWEEMFIGSQGLRGTVHSTIMLKRDPESGTRTLKTEARTGTDWPETVLQLDEESGELCIAGTKAEMTRDDLRRRILDLLAEGEVLTQEDIYAHLGGDRTAAHAALKDLCRTGRIGRDGTGRAGNKYRYYDNRHGPDREGDDRDDDVA